MTLIFSGRRGVTEGSKEELRACERGNRLVWPAATMRWLASVWPPITAEWSRRVLSPAVGPGPRAGITAWDMQLT